MAVCTEDGEQDMEHHPKIAEWSSTFRNFCANKSSTSIRPPASIWLSRVCAGYKIATKQKDRQVATKEQDSSVFGTIRKNMPEQCTYYYQ